MIATQKVLKKPAAQKVYKSTPPMPWPVDGPVFYKTGKIYASLTKKSWRVIRTASDYKTEASTKWPGDKPDEASWKRALQKIDDWAKS